MLLSCSEFGLNSFQLSHSSEPYPQLRIAALPKVMSLLEGQATSHERSQHEDLSSSPEFGTTLRDSSSSKRPYISICCA